MSIISSTSIIGIISIISIMKHYKHYSIATGSANHPSRYTLSLQPPHLLRRPLERDPLRRRAGEQRQRLGDAANAVGRLPVRAGKGLASPAPGADVVRVSSVLERMWHGRARYRCRCERV
jgi:hypothetical protein